MAKIGFITLHRTILEWEWYSDMNTKVLFIHLLLKANFADTKYKGLLVKRGSLVTGLQSLGAEIGLTVKKVRLSLTKLENSGEIRQATGNQGRIITICKYDDYQNAEKEKGRQEAGKGQTEGKQRANKGQHNNKKNKNNNENNTESALPHGELFKESWEEWNQYKREKRSKLTPTSIKRQLAKLAKIKESDAIATINQSIENNYQGLFPDKITGNGKSSVNSSLQNTNQY